MASRISYILQPVNKGKREALALGAKHAQHELLVFVDSDSFLNPYAIINLVQPFKDEQVGGVSGRTDVANTYTNSLTKMQSVRYYIAFRVMKAAEGLFDAVSCLSGPLSCYRKDLVLKYSDDWLNQKFLGQRATFGDDRAMTNMILRHNRTDYQDTAICYTIVPNDYDVFLKQQMRWKRSWLRESLIAGSFMWKKEPFAAISFYMGLLVPIIAPVIVCYNLLYIPITHRVFPTAFIIGMLLMALLMSACQALLRRSTTWLYGIWFCLYYEMVLLWQMPIAWFTFWKSTWGTRMTPADLEEQERKQKARFSEEPKVAGPAEQVVLNEVVQETAEKPAVTVKPEEKTAVMAEAPAVRIGDVCVNTIAKEESASVITDKSDYSAASKAEVSAKQEVKEEAVSEIKPVAAEEAVSEIKPVADKPAADDIADQTANAAKRVREIFSPDAAPYLDTRHLSQTLGEVHRMPLSEEIRHEQDALIELIRENQRQVAELHRLMEQRIELEKMRISAYESTLAAERNNRNAAEQRNALHDQREKSSQNIAPGQEVDEP